MTQGQWDAADASAVAVWLLLGSLARRYLSCLPCAVLCVQVDSEGVRQQSLERLSGYLEVVEAHLVREIAARTGGGGRQLIRHLGYL